MVSLRSVQGLKCRTVAGERLLAADLSLPCPAEDKGSVLFLWTLAASILYPIGVPLFIFHALRKFRVPQLSWKKRRSALLGAMLDLYRGVASQTFAAGLARYLGGTRDEVGQEVMQQRARTLFNDATDSGSARLTVGRLFEIAKRHGLASSEQHRIEIEQLVAAFDEDGSCELEWEAFWAMAREIESKESWGSGVETVDDRDDEKLEELCKFRWRDFIVGEEEKEASLKRQRIQRMKKGNQKSVDNLRSISDESSSRVLSGSARHSFRNLAAGSGAHSSSSNDGDHVPSDAPRDKKLDWLFRQGKKLVDNGALAMPIVRWDGASQEERDAIDSVGFLFENYVVECWYYEIVEMARKFTMTGLIIFMWPDSPEQIAAAMMVTVAALFYFMSLRPYTSKAVDNMQSISLLTQAATLFYGLMLNIQRASARQDRGRPDSETSVFAVVILILNYIIIVVPVFKLLVGNVENFSTTGRKLLRFLRGRNREGLQTLDTSCADVVFDMSGQAVSDSVTSGRRGNGNGAEDHPQDPPLLDKADASDGEVGLNAERMRQQLFSSGLLMPLQMAPVCAHADADTEKDVEAPSGTSSSASKPNQGEPGWLGGQPGQADALLHVPSPMPWVHGRSLGNPKPTAIPNLNDHDDAGGVFWT